jgi:2-oxoglutarate dehydrogenase E2 component (dihydrolipoamide succinyltransferase)
METDKVTVEIKSPNAGLLTKFHVKQGQNLGVGKPFFDVDVDAKRKEGQPAPAQTQKTTTPAAKQESKPGKDETAPVKPEPRKEEPKTTSPPPAKPSPELLVSRK